MKKYFFALLLILSTTVYFSCTKDSINSSIDTYEYNLLDKSVSYDYHLNDLVENPSLIGEIHNQEMDNIYDNLYLMKINEANNTKTIDEYVESIIINNLNSKINFNGVTNLESYNFLESQLSNVSDPMVNKLIDFENELYQIVDLGLSIENFNIQAGLLLSSYNNHFSDELYKKSIMIIYSVSINSYAYWNTNFDKWVRLFNNSEMSNRPGVSDAGKGRIVKADIKGAVRGAITGAIGGAFAGGIGAIPGAIVGACMTSCISSSATGIREYLGFSSWNPF
jgi:hypothetical protein